jgi:hypothetical protein
VAKGVGKKIYVHYGIHKIRYVLTLNPHEKGILIKKYVEDLLCRKKNQVDYLQLKYPSYGDLLWEKAPKYECSVIF